MPAVPNPLLQQYMKLTEFLGHALGPDYEVALHDLTNKDRSIIAIANNHISGREIGAPLTNVALSILRDRSYETSDYCLQYHGISANGKNLRSNTMFIKQDGRLIGMLCINFDDSRYRDISDRILGLCHPLSDSGWSIASPTGIVRPKSPRRPLARRRRRPGKDSHHSNVDKLDKRCYNLVTIFSEECYHGRSKNGRPYVQGPSPAADR